MTFPPILAQTPNVTRTNAPGNPRTGGWYPKAMEQGRMKEQALGDALNELKQTKQDMMDKIKNEISKALGSADSEPENPTRTVLLVARIVKFIQQVSEFVEDVQAIIAAAQMAVNLLYSMIANLRAMIQSCLNALANLLKELCNWNLPDLPSLPNLFGLFMNFPGFNIPNFGSLTQPFTFNFTLADCHIHLPNFDVLRNQPMGYTINDLQGKPIFTLPPNPITPPFNGKILTLDPPSDPVERRAIKNNTKTPVYVKGFDPRNQGDMVGSLPNPSKILSGFQLPASDFRLNILSLTNPNLIPQSGDSDYNDFDPTKSVPSNQRTDLITKTLRSEVNLGAIVDSKYDPNKISLWMFLLRSKRITREGFWVPVNQATYDGYVIPTLSYLDSTPVPFNNILDGQGISDAPTALPLIGVVKALPDDQLKTLLYKLSFVEAGLLGLERNRRWDPLDITGMMPDWLIQIPSGTKADLLVPVYTNQTLPDVKLTYDSSWKSALDRVVAKGTLDISIHPLWRTSRPQWRYIYDEFATARETDRFIQYWKEFEYNYSQLILETGLVDYVMADWALLDSAINPLGDPTLFNTLKKDWSARDKAWSPGYILDFVPRGLPIPILTVSDRPSDDKTGWAGTANMDQLQAFLDDPVGYTSKGASVPTPPVFSSSAFLSRPDVQSLPLAQQMAMLDLNQSFASMMTSATTQISAALIHIQDGKDQIFDAQKIIDQATSIDPKSIVPGKDIVDIAPYFSRGSASAVNRNSALKPAGVKSYVQSSSAPQGTSIDVPPESSASTQTISSKAGEDLPNLSVIVFGEDKSVSLVVQGGSEPPYFDGIAAVGANSGDDVTVSIIYGSVITSPSSSFTPGDLLYLAPDGTLTTDYSLASSAPWLICMGRAIDTDKFIYESHIPVQASSVNEVQFTQSAPSMEWTITHNLGRFPNVHVLDGSGEPGTPDVVYVNSNVIKLEFSVPTSGTAYLD